MRPHAEAEQTVGMPATHPHHWTAADVLAMPEQPGKKVEVIDGELFVTPAPSLQHQLIVSMLWAALQPYVSGQGLGFSFGVAGDISPAPDTLVQPDVFVVPYRDGRRPASWADVDRLLLAIEVLSPGSQRRDRVLKRHLYARMGCEYWIVDPDARLVERWLPSDERPEMCEQTIAWRPQGTNQPLVIDLAALFVEALGSP